MLPNVNVIQNRTFQQTIKSCVPQWGSAFLGCSNESRPQVVAAQTSICFWKTFSFFFSVCSKHVCDKKRKWKVFWILGNMRMFWWWCEEPTLWENNISEMQESCFQLMTMNGCLGDNSFTILASNDANVDKWRTQNHQSKLNIWN